MHHLPSKGGNATKLHYATSSLQRDGFERSWTAGQSPWLLLSCPAAGCWSTHPQGMTPAPHHPPPPSCPCLGPASSPCLLAPLHSMVLQAYPTELHQLQPPHAATSWRSDARRRGARQKPSCSIVYVDGRSAMNTVTCQQLFVYAHETSTAGRFHGL